MCGASRGGSARAFRGIGPAMRSAITCALCHSAVHDGQLVVGAARRHFDYGRLRLAFFDEFAVTVDPNMSRRLASWGPGRADVTEDDDEDP